MRRRVFALFDRKKSFPLKRSCAACMITVIIASSAALILNTEPSISARYGNVLAMIELAACLVFMAEYFLRIWSCPEKHEYRSVIKCRTAYIFSFMGAVDLLSFLPTLLIMAGVPANSGLLTLQMLRLVKLTRYSLAFDLLADVLRDEAESLLVSFVLMMIILIFASVGIYTFEHAVQPEAFGSIPSAMWWAIVTLTTVGYGDVTPVTVEGKIFATVITVAGVGLVSLPAGIIASGFTEQLRLRREQFQSEVEMLLHDDGRLTKRDMGQLEEERKELGINRDKAEFIIHQVQQREMNRQKREKRTGRQA